MLYLRNGVGHMIANYHTPVQIGFNGIIRKYEEFLNALDMSEPESLQKKIFYDSVIRTCAQRFPQNLQKRFGRQRKHSGSFRC